MTTQDLSRLIASAARALQHETSSQETLDKVVELAVALLDGAEHAGVSLVRGEQITTPAASSEVVRRVDANQYEARQGPCVAAILEEEVVVSPDIASDARWPDWGRRTAEETGIRSMVSFRMATADNTVGALNFYSSREDAFDEDDREAGAALATHAALAVVSAHRVEALHVAVDSRTTVGQAVGILMERFEVDADVAFAVLKRVSQESNRKLREVAHELITTRQTPQ